MLIGLPNVRALERAAAKLRQHSIPHYEWTEPDFEAGFTSIATAPLRGEQREVLRNYRVYNARVAQLVEQPGSNPVGVGSIPTACANGAGTDASSVLA